MGACLLHKRIIYKDTQLMTFLKEIKLFCLRFYYKKNIVENKFNDINITITNSKCEIKLDLKKKQKSARINEDKRS